MFIFTTLSYESWVPTFKNDAIVNLCTFFSLLLLHWTCLPDVRNGLYMMKYVLVHPEEFSHPVTCFLLGFIQLSSVWIVQGCCLLKCLDHGKPADVITRFVAFGGLTAIPKALTGSMESFPVSKGVSALTLKKSRKYVASQDTFREKLGLFGYVMNIVYCVMKWFYVSLYHYFFPFSCIVIPTIKLCYFSN